MLRDPVTTETNANVATTDVTTLTTVTSVTPVSTLTTDLAEPERVLREAADAGDD